MDAAAFAALDPNDPTQGFVPFAVEVKNVRSVIYAWSHETWDLLAKLGDFPDVVPVLIAGRFHVTAFRLFKDLGALGHATGHQWFHSPETTRASIDAATFLAARSTLGFYDSVLVADPAQPHAPIQKFFSQTMPKIVGGRPLIAAQADRWSRAAPIVMRYPDLRDESVTGDDRIELMTAFAQDIADEGLMTAGGWAAPSTGLGRTRRDRQFRQRQHVFWVGSRSEAHPPPPR